MPTPTPTDPTTPTPSPSDTSTPTGAPTPDPPTVSAPPAQVTLTNLDPIAGGGNISQEAVRIQGPDVHGPSGGGASNIRVALADATVLS